MAILDTVSRTRLFYTREVEPEWELRHEEKTGHSWWYLGGAEECTFEFAAPPEQIPGVEWMVGKLCDAIKAEVEKEGHVLKYQIYLDRAEWYESRWKVAITAHGSPIWWVGIIIAIIAALALAGIIVISYTLLHLKDTYWLGPAAIGIGVGVAGLGIAAVVHLVRSQPKAVEKPKAVKKGATVLATRR